MYFYFYDFGYDPADEKAEYYEMLQMLMDRWEHEVVEFKSATGQFNTDKIGQYFSAISCEANLKQQQYGWFILGVSETKEKHIVGTAFKQGDASLLEKFKYEISRDTTDGITFIDIIELYPIVNGEKKRVLMFKVPAAVVGIPTGWKNHYYARAGESLTPLPQYKIDQIRNGFPVNNYCLLDVQIHIPVQGTHGSFCLAVKIGMGNLVQTDIFSDIQKCITIN